MVAALVTRGAMAMVKVLPAGPLARMVPSLTNTPWSVSRAFWGVAAPGTALLMTVWESVVGESWVTRVSPKVANTAAAGGCCPDRGC